MGRPRCWNLGAAVLGVALLTSGLPPAHVPGPHLAAAQGAGAGQPFRLGWSSIESRFTKSVAWGDYDNDGDLDMAVGNYEQPSQVYRNDRGTFSPAWEPKLRPGQTVPDRTYAVAWGDYDGDGWLDLAVGNGGSLRGGSGGQPSRIYRNLDGTLSQEPIWSSEAELTSSLAWGDFDNDGDLDLVAGNGQLYQPSDGQPFSITPQRNRLYRNDGVDAEGRPVFASYLLPGSADATSSVAWGDYDGDLDLDLAVGNVGLTFAVEVPGVGRVPVSLGNHDRLYRNDGADGVGAPLLSLAWESPGYDITLSVAWADMDGSGALALAVGNGDVGPATLPVPPGTGAVSIEPQRNKLYRVSGGTLALDDTWAPPPATTQSLAWGDYDSDGDPDLAVGNIRPPGSDQPGPPTQVFRNDAGRLAGTPAWSAPTFDDTFSVAWGDADGDGDLDLLAGNAGPLLSSEDPGHPNRLYTNDLGTLPVAATGSVQLGGAISELRELAWGDYDGDGDLDLAVALREQGVRLVRNDGGSFLPAGAIQATSPGVNAVAWGDYDGDGDLDLAVGYGGGPNQLYRNDGGALTQAAALGVSFQNTQRLAWGDYDNDGDLDLAVANQGLRNQLYRNQVDAGGQRSMALDPAFQPPVAETKSLAWGDVDNDGDLDLAVGNRLGPNQLYRNRRGLLQLDEEWAPPASRTYAVAWGDYDGDGDLDLAVGNYGKPAWLHRNDGGRLSDQPTWSSLEAGLTNNISFGDYDGDGDLDLAVATGGFAGIGEPERIYTNDGGSIRPAPGWVSQEAEFTEGIAWGDYDGDGDLDLVTGTVQGMLRFYANRRSPPPGTSTLPTVAVGQPLAEPPLRLTGGYGTAPRLAGQTVTIPFTLANAGSWPVAQVRAYFSLNGGDSWTEAVAAAGTNAGPLATSPTGVAHSFTWDVWANRVMGQSDNVVIRLVALPSRAFPRGALPLLAPFGNVAAQSLPFRLGGTQIRVLRRGQPAAGAVVYRLEQSRTTGAEPYADLTGEPFRTDSQGYLQGRGAVAVGDRLVALQDVATTDRYTLSLSSAVPTLEGLALYNVAQPGRQVLELAPERPLLLLNLELALEWDARQDAAFLARLRANLRRAAELLFDWSDGAITLGAIQISHDRERWDEADIRLYASNRLRPNATQGGIVRAATADPDEPSISYEPGQVRIGAVWTRFGDGTEDLGQDWAAALAHEIAHYALFLDDNYLGYDGGTLSTIDTCPGAMSDPYSGEQSEFRPPSDWSPGCDMTLAGSTTRRSDWATIARFYDRPDLAVRFAPPETFNANPGPETLPLVLPVIRERAPAQARQPLDNPLIDVRAGGGPALTGPAARAVLYRAAGDGLVDLGSVNDDTVTARGARVGDRLCVYELERSRAGCIESLSAAGGELRLEPLPGWRPDLRITPVTSRTLVVRLGLPEAPAVTTTVRARFFPASGGTAQQIELRRADERSYEGAVTLGPGAEEGHVQVWVEGSSAPREAVADYSLGGSPGLKRARGAPALSADGQVILFVDEDKAKTGDVLLIQRGTNEPPPLPGRALVGPSYWIQSAGGDAALTGAAVNIRYDPRAVPPGAEPGIQLAHWDGQAWVAIETKVDQARNEASARLTGAGLYALLSSIPITLYGPGWEQFGFPLAAPQPVREALASIEGSYFVVYGYEPTGTGSPWRSYAVGVPAWVNDLVALEPYAAYLIYMGRPDTLHLSPRAGRLGQSEPVEEPAQAPGGLQPPARLYGTLGLAADHQIVKGDQVTALVDELECGSAAVQEIEGELRFVIDVLANHQQDAQNCGAPGSTVTLRVGGLRADAVWDNRLVQEVLFGIQPDVYLPLVRR